MALVVDYLTPAGPPAAAPAEDVTVLVVDDSPVDRRLAGGLIERQRRWRVLYAAHGLEALDLLERGPVQDIVTDMLMPEMDGLELVDAVRQGYPFVPVMLMTLFSGEDVIIM